MLLNINFQDLSEKSEIQIPSPYKVSVLLKMTSASMYKMTE